MFVLTGSMSIFESNGFILYIHTQARLNVTYCHLLSSPLCSVWEETSFDPSPVSLHAVAVNIQRQHLPLVVEV